MHPLILTNDNTGREADHLLSISEPIAYKDANPFEAFSGPWPPSSSFYKLLEIERQSSLNLSLRHEVARLIVWHVVTRHVVPSAVSYADVREGNDSYSACGHGTHSHWTGTKTVRQRCLCQHQAERGLDGGYGEQTCTLDKRRDEHQA
jgi:hypothetical protein